MSLFDKFSKKAETEDETAGRIPPGQHLTKGFPVLTYGATQHVKTAEWSCRIFGLVGKEATFDWDELMALPQTEVHCDIHCVTRWSMLDTTWVGVRFVDFLKAVEAKCGPLPAEATHVMQHSYGGYTTNTPLSFLTDENVLLAHTFKGEPLTDEHGGPLRMMVPKYYFWKSAKWLNGFEFMNEDRAGFWERYGYHMRGDPWQEERFG